MLQQFTQEIKNLFLTMAREMHTAIPGHIESFDADTCEADVLPYGMFRKPDGSLLAYPKLTGVPVYFMQGTGQGATFVFPVKPGDECLLIFCEQTLDTWLTKAESQTDLSFDLSNAIALVGLFARANPLVKVAVDRDAVIIDRGGTRITMLPSNQLEIIGNTSIVGTLTVSSNAHIRGNMQVDGTVRSPEVISSTIDVNTHVHWTDETQQRVTGKPRG